MLLKKFYIPVFFCLLFAVMTNVHAQSVLDDIDEEEQVESDSPKEKAPNLAEETVKSISSSRKIFVLTNENQTFNRGDFISLLIANKLVCRALVAKTTDEKLSGVKIVKIYNLSLWKQITAGKNVLVLKGDDSYYANLDKKPAKEEVAKNKSKLQTEEDLFNSTSLSGNDDDLTLEESTKRLIRPDNLLSFNVGLIEGKDVDGAAKKYTQINGSWAYQISDNIWGEAGIGRNTITDYPYSGLDTALTNITVKAKYTFSAPFYSYLQPYVGYQSILASSPSAGQDPGDGSRTQEELQQETVLVNDLKKNSAIFGVTILKRIVPGWFARADLGTDILNGGLTIEF